MKITHRLIQTGLSTLLCSVLASRALAATLTLSTNAYSNGNGLGGGEYTAISSTLSNSNYSLLAIAGLGGVETFCLEYGEHFTSGGVYNYTISNAATAGSGGAVNGQDPLSKASAWLYSQFATGTLANFNYGAGRSASNNDLQLAFWFFEDETQVIGGSYASYGVSSNNVFINAAVAQFGSVAAAKSDAGGAYGVSVLNLTTGTQQNQSQLYYTGNTVPDGGSTALFLGLSVIGLLGLRRRTVSK